MDQVVAAAAMIGGISYFHEFAFDLLAENERILASTFEAAIAAHEAGRLRRIVVLSSSMVFESDDRVPDARGRRADLAPADLHVRLPEARVGVLRARRLGAVPAAVHDPAAVQLRGRSASGGPLRDTDVMSGNVKLALSHVVPGPRAQGRSRARTRCTSWATATRSATTPTAATSRTGSGWRWSRDAAVNEDFNLSTAASTTVLELAEAIWAKVHDGAKPFRYVSDPPFDHDVQLRVPDVRKAREVLGFEATTSLGTMLDEVIPWIGAELEAGRL